LGNGNWTTREFPRVNRITSPIPIPVPNSLWVLGIGEAKEKE